MKKYLVLEVHPSSAWYEAERPGLVGSVLCSTDDSRYPYSTHPPGFQRGSFTLVVKDDPRLELKPGAWVYCSAMRLQELA